jgi:type 1 glutamine amidotransferase
MKQRRLGVITIITIASGAWALAQQPPPPAGRAGGPAVGQAQPGAPAAGRQGAARGGGRGAATRTRKTVLAWADTRNGISQHESVSRALALVSDLGYRTGSWDTWIRTDSHIISKTPLRTDGTTPASGGPNLNNVDAIFFMGHREVPLDAKQKEDLLSFVRDDGKGFVAAHVGLTALESWPEFGELIGGRFDGHPIVGAGTVINEDTNFPATRHFPASFAFNDEFYQPKAFSRDKIHVLLRLDLTNVPARPGLNRTDGDHPLAWAKMYGKGRVFYGSFAHANETWDVQDVQRMYYEAIRWALGLSEATLAPHAMRGSAPASAAAPAR